MIKTGLDNLVMLLEVCAIIIFLSASVVLMHCNIYIYIYIYGLSCTPLPYSIYFEHCWKGRVGLISRTVPIYVLLLAVKFLNWESYILTWMKYNMLNCHRKDKNLNTQCSN